MQERKSGMVDRTNAVCGAFFILLGLLFGAQSLAIDLGSSSKIGPGGLPLVLSALFALIGVVILVSALRTASDEGSGVIAWRGIFFILLAPIVFGLTVRGLGFIASVFISALLASFASVKMKPAWALVLAVALTIFSTIVFSYGLGLPFERIGPWLRF